MKAIMLAAGVGSRLGSSDTSEDVTGLPWTEIDSASDRQNALANILLGMSSSPELHGREVLGTVPTQLATDR